MNKKIFSLLVENNAGVVYRITGLFSRRSFKIDSITGGETDNPKLSRITIATHGDEEILVQIARQLAKLEEVIQIRVLEPSNSIIRNLVLIRATVAEEERAQIISMADVFRAKVVDIAKDSLTFELTGDDDKVSAFMRLLGEERVTKVAKTGVTGLTRGMFDASEVEIYNR